MNDCMHLNSIRNDWHIEGDVRDTDGTVKVVDEFYCLDCDTEFEETRSI